MDRHIGKHLFHPCAKNDKSFNNFSRQYNLYFKLKQNARLKEVFHIYIIDCLQKSLTGCIFNFDQSITELQCKCEQKLSLQL